ncbi:MAG: metallophosphoesterase [Victivallales bacterium]|nr:metallophosphoesterase [Victivallales bacterium]
MMKSMIALFSVTLLTCASLCAQNSPGGGTYGRAMKIARNYEIAPMVRPEWADRKDQPLFRMCWMSDLHISKGEPLEIVTAGCNEIRDKLKPDFVLINGDNNTDYVGDDLPAKFAKAPYKYKKQAWLRHFLDQELALPYEILPGDNDPDYFIDVFGSFHRSFDFGGFHFLLTGNDAGGSQEGCSVFDESTVKWMKDNLKANADKPTFFVVHETVWPPFFIDATLTSNMLNDSPNVLAVLSGHMHLDLDFERGSWRQLVCPSLGRSHRPAFKHLKFYDDMVVIESHEWGKGHFLQAMKWQKIDIPKRFRKELKTAHVKENASELPPTPKRYDKSLNERANEQSNALMGFILSFGFGRVFGN